MAGSQECVWASAGSTEGVSIILAYVDNSTFDGIKQYSASGQAPAGTKIIPLAGLGDEAFEQPSTVPNSAPLIYVKKGSLVVTVAVVSGVNGVKGSVGQDVDAEKAAAAIVARKL